MTKSREIHGPLPWLDDPYLDRPFSSAEEGRAFVRAICRLNGPVVSTEQARGVVQRVRTTGLAHEPSKGGDQTTGASTELDEALSRGGPS